MSAGPQVIFANGAVFQAGALVGKTLIAERKVIVINSSGNPVGYVNQGQPVGVVYSWLDIKPGVRPVLWWQFELNGGFYYVAHQQNLFNVSAIKKQGVLTLDEIYKKELEKADNESRGWLSKMLGLPSQSSVASGLSNVLVTGGLIAGAVYLIGVYIKKNK